MQHIHQQQIWMTFIMFPPRCSIILLLFLASSGFCAKPKLEIIPSKGEIYLGKQQSFICKSTVEATIKWLTEDGEEIEDEEGRYKQDSLDETTQTLHVTASKVEPDRVIKCQAESESGEIISSEIKLRIIQKPSFVHDLDVEKVFDSNSVVQIPCAAEGIPPPQITWFRNEMAIPIAPGRVSATRDGTLTIEKIQLSDAGIYYCQAYIHDRDRIEIAYKNVTVIVNAAPIASFQESSPNITSKSNASFTCFVIGHPQPQITWKKGDKVVSHDGQKYILSSDGLQLSITDLAKADEGEYTCYASNSLGEDNTTLFLQVIEPPHGIGAAVLAGIIILIVLLILLAVDLTCYRTRRSGFLMYMATKVLGRPEPRVKLEDDIKKETTEKSHVVKISGIDA
ncbi:neural cell adhesion molecule 2-like [Pyxicephalus adspersus]|uniref:neural cell adhesion molecule 2-like n=1 Tax=Pyxicephalus adspersus TaxID=30357 RepID=UPI003B5CC738